MSDYTELVKALRWCSVDEYVPCTGCPMNEETHGTGCFNIMHQRAAAAIEALQAEQKKTVTQIFGEEQMAWEGRCKDLMKHISDLQDEVDTLKRTDSKRCQECLYLGQPVGEQQLPKRGEWIEENRRPRSSQFVCSECHRTAYDPQPTRDKAWRKRCRYAYCPNCGAYMPKMEVQDG